MRRREACLRRHVRFDLQALGSRGQEESRRKACELKISTATMGELNIFAAQRSAATEHTKVHDSVLGHEPMTDSLEANIDWPIDEKNPHVPERDTTDVSAERYIRCPEN